MRTILAFGVLAFMTGVCQADMGYFGTIAQNPVPVDTFEVHPFIELSCEDVLIEIFPEGEAAITADFLFTNTGPADTVLMYFPLSIMVPTISVLWDLEDVTDPLDEPLVMVNGERVSVRPLLCTLWNGDYREEGEWENFRGLVDVLTPEEPDSGFAFYIADPGYWGGSDMLETMLSDSLTPMDWCVLDAYSSHALWEVPFAEGESVLVEYTTVFRMRYEWEQPFLYLSYPLYTGASWAGPIGSGRIVVRTAEGREFGDITGWSTTSMPEGIEVADYPYHPLPEMEGAHPGTLLRERQGGSLDSALVWMFEGLEPVVSPQGWMYYYEDSRSENARLQAEMSFWPEKPPPWPSGIRVTVYDEDFQQY